MRAWEKRGWECYMSVVVEEKADEPGGGGRNQKKLQNKTREDSPFPPDLPPFATDIPEVLQ